GARAQSCRRACPTTLRAASLRSLSPSSPRSGGPVEMVTHLSRHNQGLLVCELTSFTCVCTRSHKAGLYAAAGGVVMPLSRHMPELSAFEIFLAIARTGSLGAAAREFGLTQQAVSARLASIEAQTGVALVVRTPRGSQLTPAGVVVAEWADRLID